MAIAISDLDGILDSCREEIHSLRTQNQRSWSEHELWFLRKNFEGPWKDLDRNTRTATKEDYMAWLKGYLLGGGRPTNGYDYDIHADLPYFFVAEKGFKTTPLELPGGGRGLSSKPLSIIIPENIKVSGNPGSAQAFFYMDGFKTKGDWVPVYGDLKFGKET